MFSPYRDWMIPPENSSSLRYLLEHQHQITALCSNAFHCSHSAVLPLDMQGGA